MITVNFDEEKRMEEDSTAAAGLREVNPAPFSLHTAGMVYASTRLVARYHSAVRNCRAPCGPDEGSVEQLRSITATLVLNKDVGWYAFALGVAPFLNPQPRC